LKPEPLIELCKEGFFRLVERIGQPVFVEKFYDGYVYWWSDCQALQIYNRYFFHYFLERECDL